MERRGSRDRAGTEDQARLLALARVECELERKRRKRRDPSESSDGWVSQNPLTNHAASLLDGPASLVASSG